MSSIKEEEDAKLKEIKDGIDNLKEELERTKLCTKALVEEEGRLQQSLVDKKNLIAGSKSLEEMLKQQMEERSEKFIQFSTEVVGVVNA